MELCSESQLKFAVDRRLYASADGVEVGREAMQFLANLRGIATLEFFQQTHAFLETRDWEVLYEIRVISIAVRNYLLAVRATQY